ncbi:DUF3445 domain-containing protein [Alisedimentitalea sp. MJ-SS2]|uniref:heme-dependent oxidative N-demethylase family protein n=1 Tax=Aliisedimentitalea sp. MJ-SS2 TaxID=3049795 RepID=UPI0029115428|nr:DUF3445 domain-containing protein [Alisedimentitalea sp. MJ-SS2]MDU8926495.1 DUF3445 domain-containing protein [Alisedimentitalea sp. MJ-SS2]
MILQRSIPYDPLTPMPLPGISPLDKADWITVDDAYNGQMEERGRLIREARDAVIALEESARPAAEELLDEVIRAALEKPGFAYKNKVMMRPDGGAVKVDRADPLGTLGQLVQEDFCILEKQGDEHVLTGAVLCFPASWSLDEKFMKPLIGIHVPVASYDDNIARRVQRLFDGVRVERPMWRFNVLWYADATLHQPRREANRRAERGAHEAQFLRSEKQTIRRLPETEAVVFGIHTYVLREEDVAKRG